MVEFKLPSGREVQIDYLKIKWDSNIGFGELTCVYNPETKKWEVDDEYMGREFVDGIADGLDQIKNNMILSSDE